MVLNVNTFQNINQKDDFDDNFLTCIALRDVRSPLAQHPISNVVRAVSGEPTTSYNSSLGRPFTTRTEHPISYVVRAVSGEPYRYPLQPAISVATPVSPIQS